MRVESEGIKSFWRLQETNARRGLHRNPAGYVSANLTFGSYAEVV